MPDENRRRHVRNLVGFGLDAPGVPEALRTYHKSVRSMAESLKSGDWLAGDSYSLADITMLPYVLRLQHLGLDWTRDEYPRVAAWQHGCMARASYQSIAQHLDPKYLEIMQDISTEQRDRVNALINA
jgi:glutathione S-transferase